MLGTIKSDGAHCKSHHCSVALRGGSPNQMGLERWLSADLAEKSLTSLASMGTCTCAHIPQPPRQQSDRPLTFRSTQIPDGLTQEFHCTLTQSGTSHSSAASSVQIVIASCWMRNGNSSHPSLHPASASRSPAVQT